MLQLIVACITSKLEVSIFNQVNRLPGRFSYHKDIRIFVSLL